jgi:AraC-like DNA-binding protein
MSSFRYPNEVSAGRDCASAKGALLGASGGTSFVEPMGSLRARDVTNPFVAGGVPAGAMSATAPHGRTLSVRLLWPFLRAAGSSPSTMQILARYGIGAHRIVRPDARVDSGAAVDALEAYVRISGDGSIGVRAGAAVEPGELGMIEHAARCCENVREAIACWSRHVRAAHDDAEVFLVEEGGAALCVIRANEVARESSAASAFVVAAAATLLRRHASLTGPLREIHLRDLPSRSVGEELRTMAATIRFGMPHDAVVLDRWQLDAPTLHPMPELRGAFEALADELSSGARNGFRRRTRDVAASELRSGRLSMNSAATALGVSPSTLRRKLQGERTTFREIVDEVRCDLAERYLLDPGRSIGEISALLGFSYVAAFNKAFRRWKGVSPSEHRARTS